MAPIYTSIRARYYGGIRQSTDFQVVHYTANSGDKATARGNANYFANCDRVASANFTIDEHEIYECVPLDYIPYAVGGNLYPATKYGAFYGRCTNANSISYEMVSHTDSNGRYFIPQETIENTLELVKEHQKMFNIPNDHVIRHADVNGKPCPWCWTNLNGYNEDAWIHFKERLEGVEPDKAPVNQDILYRVQVGAFNSYYYAENYKDEIAESGFEKYTPFTARVNGLWKVQVGAFRNKDYAYDFRDTVREAGFEGAFITSSEKSAVIVNLKPVEEIAREVILGKWGNGNARRTALEVAGYNYSEVQSVVSKLLVA